MLWAVLQPGPLGYRFSMPPFVAAVLFHPVVSIIASLVTPFLNHLLTGMPPQSVALILSFELTIFSVVAILLSRRWPRFWGSAPAAYILAKIASLLLLAILPMLLVPVTPGQFFTTSLMNAIPGLVMLLVINVLTVWGINRVG